MESETELNAKILAITNKIKQSHPELLKYLDEMPVTIPDVEKPEVNVDTLRAHYESLCELLKKFPDHAPDLNK